MSSSSATVPSTAKTVDESPNFEWIASAFNIQNNVQLSSYLQQLHSIYTSQCIPVAPLSHLPVMPPIQPPLLSPRQPLTESPGPLFLHTNPHAFSSVSTFLEPCFSPGISASSTNVTTGSLSPSDDAPNVKRRERPISNSSSTTDITSRPNNDGLKLSNNVISDPALLRLIALEDEANTESKDVVKSVVNNSKTGNGRSCRYWSVEEHFRFLEGVHLFGLRDAKSICNYLGGTRTMTQVRTHAQKYIQRLDRENEAGMTLSDASKSKGRRTAMALATQKIFDAANFSNSHHSDRSISHAAAAAVALNFDKSPSTLTTARDPKNIPAVSLEDAAVGRKTRNDTDAPARDIAEAEAMVALSNWF